MGYEPEDLPWEVPLIELGLDSLMAVRIKNRVEYDFDLPPIQLTAVRDANLYNVEKLIEYAIEHRDEVQDYARAPEGADARGDRGRAGGAAGRQGSGRGGRAAADSAAATRPMPAGPASAPPPTDPSGPGISAAADRSARGPGQSAAAAAAAKVLTQEAVTEALGADVPPREAAERVTFATWAIVTGKSPGGIFNELPAVDDDTAAKIARAALRARRGHHHRRGGEGRQDHRAVGHHGPRVPRSRRARGLRADPARAAKHRGRSADPGVRLPSGRRIDGGLRAAAQAAARRHPGVRPRAGRGLHRGARRRVRAQADGVGRQGPLHPGRLVTGRSAGLRLRGGPQAQRVRRPLRRADRHRARRRGGAADQGGDPRPLGSLRPVRAAHLQRRDPGDPVRAARAARRRRSGAVRAGRRQGEPE